jgi:hypothetical protein
MFTSRQQTTARNHYIKVAKCCKWWIFRNDCKRQGSHSRTNQTKFGERYHSRHNLLPYRLISEDVTRKRKTL